MGDGTAAIALGAGMLAALNPCGFALLPAYLTLLITGDQPSRITAVLRAVRMTAAMTAGFTTVFAVFGLVVAPVTTSAQRYLPWFTVAVGVTLAGAGLWRLAGGALPRLRLRATSRAPVTRSARSTFGFGVSYALASLTCTVAPFLAVVVAAFRADSLVAGSTLFLVYAAGMGLVVGVAAVAVALAQHSVVRTARRLGRVVPAAGGVLLVVIGSYVAYYGWWEIRVLGGASTHDPVVAAASAVQQWLAGAVRRLGPWGFLLALTGIAAALGVTALVRRHTTRTPVDDKNSTPWAESGVPERSQSPDSAGAPRRSVSAVGTAAHKEDAAPSSPHMSGPARLYDAIVQRPRPLAQEPSRRRKKLR